MRARPRHPVQGRGIFSGTGVIIVGLTATIAALVFPIWSYADRSDPTGAVNVLSAQTVSTRYGPLSALDRDFIVKVRLAGLWELPAGEMAEEKGTTAAVRTAGQHLVDGHAALDAHVRTVATQLGVPIPNGPNAQQQQWLATLAAAQGQDFDREFANIVRLAHGRVFSVVAQVRAGTQNTLVREPRRRRQRHRPGPHQGPGGHRVRRLLHAGPAVGGRSLPRRLAARRRPARRDPAAAVTGDDVGDDTGPVADVAVHPAARHHQPAAGLRQPLTCTGNGTSHTDNTRSGM